MLAKIKIKVNFVYNTILVKNYYRKMWLIIALLFYDSVYKG